jgi:hypothetical protein
VVPEHYHPYENKVGKNIYKLLVLQQELLSLANFTTNNQITIM